MSLKANISINVTPLGVRSRISSEFHELLNESLLRDSSYAVISFPGMRGESTSIVDSKSLEKALRRLAQTDEQLIVVAHNFTSEAREMLSNLKAICVSKSDFYWSDESWARIRDK